MMSLIKRFYNQINAMSEGYGIILMYHQIAERKSDPWSLAVSPELFDRQLDFIKRNYEVVPLSVLTEAVRKKDLHRKMMAITFDDGFKDNYTNAHPILDHHSLPATFFVSTSLVGTNQCYWWDELETIILHSEELPKQLKLSTGNSYYYFKLENDAILNKALISEISDWTFEQEPANERLKLFLQLWEILQPLPPPVQQQLMAQIRAWSKSTHVTSNAPCIMTLNEIQEISRRTLYEIGAHTVNHPMLGKHHVTFQKTEIQESKDTIEKWIGKRVTAFAYPYGHFDDTTKSLVAESGFASAVSTAESGVDKSSDLFCLPRLQVRNWQVAKFQERLKSLHP